ncbi:MAG: ABC transporter ATP-binding protein [Bacteroidales bacterium]|nr:ABC transporter ATP-binding protein [Bacteroidales bacterium]
MKDAIRIFRIYLPPYKGTIALNVLFNLFAAVFNLVSIVMLIPVLEILFNQDAEKVYTLKQASGAGFSISEFREVTINNLYAHVQNGARDLGGFKVLIIVGVVYVVLVLFKTGFTYLGSLSMVFIRNNVIRDIRNRMYEKIIHLPIGFFTEERKGDILARVTGDVAEIEKSVMSSLDMFFKNPLLILITVGGMVVISWQLTMFVFLLLPVAGGLLGVIGKKLRKTSLEAQNKMGEILSTIEESVSGLRIIKAFNAESTMQKQQQEQNQQYRRLQNGVMSRQQMASPMSEFLGTIIILTVLIFGGKLILDNDKAMLEPSMFIAYIALFFTIIQPAKAFASAFYNIQKGLASMTRIDQILDAVNPILSPEKPVHIDKLEQALEYRNVSFRYGEEYILENIDLHIAKGKTIALVGQSGSGKSTLVDLAPRFYDVEKGEILIDGINIRELDLKELRNLFGIVNQEPILFNDTIKNNIAFGETSATDEEIIQAAKIANAHDFIVASPEGYQTCIGDRGSKLSGGQRQRLSIARAILKNPPILILDEATSALDTESERLVQEAINNLMKHRTSIVIAHRLSTIRNVDEIYVLSKGKIIEKGGYQELLDLNGEFKKLHDNQFDEA